MRVDSIISPPWRAGEKAEEDRRVGVARHFDVPHRRPIMSGVAGFVYFPNLSQRTGGGASTGGGRKLARQGGDANASCFTRSLSTVETWPLDFS